MTKNTPENDKFAAKKAAVLASNQKKSLLPLLAMLGCAAAVIGGGVMFWTWSGAGVSSGVQPTATAPQATEVTLAASQFDDGKARFYRYEAGDGITIQYFVLKSSDGVIRAAFDACDSCWPAGKGYYQDGDEMVCRNCRRRFASVKVNEVKGGCNPAPLRREVVNGRVVIRVADILAGKGYFVLPQEG
ncbi:MAG: hypothetical protein Kow0092_06880 [Deferrisomatales bacterium]